MTIMLELLLSQKFVHILRYQWLQEMKNTIGKVCKIKHCGMFPYVVNCALIESIAI